MIPFLTISFSFPYQSSLPSIYNVDWLLPWLKIILRHEEAPSRGWRLSKGGQLRRTRVTRGSGFTHKDLLSKGQFSHGSWKCRPQTLWRKVYSRDLRNFLLHLSPSKNINSIIIKEVSSSLSLLEVFVLAPLHLLIMPYLPFNYIKED